MVGSRLSLVSGVRLLSVEKVAARRAMVSVAVVWLAAASNTADEICKSRTPADLERQWHTELDHRGKTRIANTFMRRT
jgi:hypothetical protein